jgi:hypothetical protein
MIEIEDPGSLKRRIPLLPTDAYTGDDTNQAATSAATTCPAGVYVDRNEQPANSQLESALTVSHNGLRDTSPRADAPVTGAKVRSREGADDALSNGSNETGKLDETDIPDVSNVEFVRAVFGDLPDGDHAAVCAKGGDPQAGGWPARRADKFVRQLSDQTNNYVSCSTFHIAPDGTLTAKKERIAAYRFISLDDLGGKIPLKRLKDFRVSWRVETSPGNYQAGIILREPITDIAAAEALQNAIMKAGLCDPGASGLTRWARLPVGVNGKPKYFDASGRAFRCSLTEWRPELRYTVEERSFKA